jgi:three-Cys-motif partner protein
MPSFKPTDLWPAEPHTLAKIEIVRRYLYLWFSILGNHPGRRLVYIDGFAGPGEYTNSDQSSPIAALAAAKSALERSGSGLASKECCFLFVEKRREFASHLRSVISKTKWPEQFKWEVEEGTFQERVGDILDHIGSAGQQLAPSFAFIDPFGATGLPFTIVANILSYRSCEVLINLDSDGIGRLAAAQDLEKNRAHLDVIFGDSSWRSEINPKLPMRQLTPQILALYKQRLRSLPKVRYIFAFAMNTREGQLNYHLVFASQHPLGLEKMKEAMKAVDRSGTYSFSDDRVGQGLLPFDFDAPAVWAERMEKALSGVWRSYDELRDYALNETPFVNPKSMLRHLLDQEKIQLQWVGMPARRGSFPEDKIRAIRIGT